MLYAQVDKRRWDDIPAEWDEVRAMFQYLQRMTWGHQITFEARMFNSSELPQYRATLIRWENALGNRDLRKREVLLETTDPAQMKAALLMLISEAEPEYKAAKMQLGTHLP
jgi:hypothetical protein